MRISSAAADELPSAIERLQNEGKDLRKQVKDLQSKLAAAEGDALADAAIETAGIMLVAAALEGWDPAALKTVASRIAERPRHMAVLVGQSVPAAIVIARAPDVSTDAAALLRQLVARHGGKGGGRADLAQGGGIAAPADRVLQSARELIAS